MNEKSFVDNIDNETLAEMIDKTLNFKKTAKNRNIRTTLLKIVPAVAAIALVIGLVNILPALLNFNADKIDPNSEITSGEDIYTPEIDQSDLFLPSEIEKNFFEEKILDAITDARDFDTMTTYYVRNNDRFYVLDPSISKREKDQLLDYLREYTDLTYTDIVQMCRINDIPMPKDTDPAYAHVRFGDTENTLLLDVEWYTYDTYMEEKVEAQKKWYDEFIESEIYKEGDDEYKERFENSRIEVIESMQKTANEIEKQEVYIPRLINGKITRYEFYVYNGYYDSNCNYIQGVVDISDYLDKDGYYIFDIYPYYILIDYFDEENDEYRFYGKRNDDGSVSASSVNSTREYDNLMKNEIKPIFDDQLARGVITQEFYDNFFIESKNPADYYIDMWFN